MEVLHHQGCPDSLNESEETRKEDYATPLHIVWIVITSSRAAADS